MSPSGFSAPVLAADACVKELALVRPWNLAFVTGITKFFAGLADLITMLKLLLLFALQVASPREMACVGSIQEMTVPEDVYVSGVEGEGIETIATPGQILYLDGPGVAQLKVGTVQRVVRPEGKVRDPRTRTALGTYYKDVGTVQIEAVYEESATARVLLSCEGMLKGDAVIPSEPRVAVEFNGALSNDVTPVPRGASSWILLAKDDLRALGAGNICFIGLGRRDGVKAGDRFTVFREHPSFNSQDMETVGTDTESSYSPVRGIIYRFRMNSKLRDRQLPPKILGDIVIVEAGERVSTGKIINSMSEIMPGDPVVKR